MRRTMSVLVALLLVQWLISSSVSAAARGCSGGVVALTFDDGPSPETEAILDALKLHNLRATFFLVGWNVEAYPEIARRIVREGHHVGNHTYSHPDLTMLTAEEVDQELGSTNDIIERVTGVRPRFVRPPYGSTNAAVRAVMVANGLTEVIWSQDSWDWAGASPAEILNQLTLVPPGRHVHHARPDAQHAGGDSGHLLVLQYILEDQPDLLPDSSRERPTSNRYWIGWVASTSLAPCRGRGGRAPTVGTRAVREQCVRNTARLLSR